MTKHPILFLAANPFEADRVLLGKELSAIQEQLERSGHRDQFSFVTRSAMNPRDVQRELRALQPTVIHFTGHGRAQVLASPAVELTLGTAGVSVKLVVLSRCYTDAQAAAVLEHVPCVVGTGGTISDTAARSFASAFYCALTDGDSIAVAFVQGCNAAGAESMPAGDRPQLRLRDGMDAHILDASEAAAQKVSARRDIASEDRFPTGLDRAGRNLIVVIGIDRYRHTQHWRRLSNAARDACGAAALFEQLGFVQAMPALIDDAATGRAIQGLASDDSMVLDPNDSLVLFYAGHGGNRRRRIGSREGKISRLATRGP